MSQFTEIVQSMIYNFLSILHAYVEFTRAFLLHVQEIRSHEEIRVFETVVFGTTVFPWLVGTVVRYGPIMTRLEPTYRILRGMPLLYEVFVWFFNGYMGNIPEHSDLTKEQFTPKLLGEALLEELQTTSKPPFHYICGIITLTIGIGILDPSKLIPGLILGISIWCGQHRTNIETGQMPRQVEFGPKGIKITPGEENFGGFQIVNPVGGWGKISSPDQDVPEYFTRQTTTWDAKQKLTSDDVDRVLDSIKILEECQKKWDAFILLNNRAIINKGTHDKIELLNSLKKCTTKYTPYDPSKGATKHIRVTTCTPPENLIDNPPKGLIDNGTRDKIKGTRDKIKGTRDKINPFNYDFVLKVAGSVILPDRLIDTMIRDPELIDNLKHLLEVSARNNWFRWMGAENPKHCWKWPTTYVIPGDIWWSTCTRDEMPWRKINIKYILALLMRSLYHKLNANLGRILTICVALEAVVIGGVMLGGLIPEILANTPPDFTSNLPPQPPGGMVRPPRRPFCPAIPPRPEVYVEKVGAEKVGAGISVNNRVGFSGEQVGFSGEGFSGEQVDFSREQIGSSGEQVRIAGSQLRIDEGSQQYDEVPIFHILDPHHYLAKILDAKTLVPNAFRPSTGPRVPDKAFVVDDNIGISSLAIPSEPIPSEVKQSVRKGIRERIRNSTGSGVELHSTGSGVELHSTGTGVEPLSSSIDWAKDDTTLAEVLSSFIDWAKEISIGDITLAEVLSPFINWSKEISIGDNPLVELDWAGVISLERGYYCLILLITIIILGRLWGDSITVNVTSLEPVRTTENKITTQINRILTPEVKWIISVIICLFLYYFYINRATLEITPMYFIATGALTFGFLIVGLRNVLQWFGNSSTEDLYISPLSKLFINPVQKFLQMMFAYVKSIFYKLLPGKNTPPPKGMIVNATTSLSVLVCVNGAAYTDHYCEISGG